MFCGETDYDVKKEIVMATLDWSQMPRRGERSGKAQWRLGIQKYADARVRCV